MAKESTLVGFPYDSRLIDGKYDRAINSPTFRKLILKYFTTGVFPNPSTNLQVFANSELNVTVKAGYANVNGVFCELKEDITLNLDSTSTYSRIDRIVLRHDDSEGVRATKVMILKGAADNNPQPVSLTRNETVYDICLANVTVKTSGRITQAEISDTRLDNDVCGIVTGAIKNVDTTTLYNQIQSDLDQFKENEKQEWTIWFNAIKEELEQIDVGQLTQDIQQIKQDYVSKSDIVNNVTSGGTNKPLSAEQGKVLNENLKGIKINSINRIVIKSGSITLNIKGNAYATLFTANQIKEMLGLNSYDYKKVTAVITNGDSSLLGQKIDATYISSVDGSLSITLNNVATGNFAINYAIIYDMD